VPTGGKPIAMSDAPSHIPSILAEILPASPLYSVDCGKKLVNISAPAPITLKGLMELELAPLPYVLELELTPVPYVLVVSAIVIIVMNNLI
jgi:hypothetical protein